MGTYGDEKYVAGEETGETLKTYSCCLWSFLASMTGGFILAWWECEYHPTNSQLWMVPSGLILFFTPVIVWFAVVVSGARNLREDDGAGASQVVVSIHESAEKEGKVVNRV